MKTYQSLFKPAASSPAYSFFAGGNTASGFRLSPDRRVPGNGNRDLLRLYVIKGSSGSGKSTLMRQVAAWAEQNGLNVTFYLCGSDPDSLDGIRIDGASGSVGIIDGTAPHMTDPDLPGITGRWILLTDLEEGLKDRTREAYSLLDRKKAAYQSAGHALRIFADLDRLGKHLSSGAFRLEKAAAYLDRRFGRSVGTDMGHTVLTHGVTMRGAVYLPTLMGMADHVYSLTDTADLGPLFLGLLSSEAKKRRLSPVVAVSPLDQTTVLSVYLPSFHLTFTTSPGGEPFRLERFANHAAMTGNRAEIKMILAEREAAFKHAVSFLAEAAEAHFALEALFRPALNPERLNAVRDEITDEIRRLML